eukprot:gene24602-biopygen10446
MGRGRGQCREIDGKWRKKVGKVADPTEAEACLPRYAAASQLRSARAGRRGCRAAVRAVWHGLGEGDRLPRLLIGLERSCVKRCGTQANIVSRWGGTMAMRCEGRDHSLQPQPQGRVILLLAARGELVGVRALGRVGSACRVAGCPTDSLRGVPRAPSGVSHGLPQGCPTDSLRGVPRTPSGVSHGLPQGCPTDSLRGVPRTPSGVSHGLPQGCPTDSLRGVPRTPSGVSHGLPQGCPTNSLRGVPRTPSGVSHGLPQGCLTDSLRGVSRTPSGVSHGLPQGCLTDSLRGVSRTPSGGPGDPTWAYGRKIGCNAYVFVKCKVTPVNKTPPAVPSGIGPYHMHISVLVRFMIWVTLHGALWRSPAAATPPPPHTGASPSPRSSSRVVGAERGKLCKDWVSVSSLEQRFRSPRSKSAAAATTCCRRRPPPPPAAARRHFPPLRTAAAPQCAAATSRHR